MKGEQYLGTQYFVNCNSLSSLSRILGHIEPSKELTFNILLDLFIMYNLMSSSMVIIGLLLASTNTLLKASDMLLTSVSHLTLVLNLDLDQYLFTLQHISILILIAITIYKKLRNKWRNLPWRNNY